LQELLELVKQRPYKYAKDEAIKKRFVPIAFNGRGVTGIAAEVKERL
jgi:hypothetical protein